MNKAISSIMTRIFAAMLIISCGSVNTEQNNNDQQVTDQTEKDSTKTVTAKFLDAGGIEGEISLTFEKVDGTKIGFFRNYMNPNEPKLKYEFLALDGTGGANKSLIGATFIIKYIDKPNGGPSGMIGEGEPCSQILSVEKK